MVLLVTWIDTIVDAPIQVLVKAHVHLMFTKRLRKVLDIRKKYPNFVDTTQKNVSYCRMYRQKVRIRTVEGGLKVKHISDFHYYAESLHYHSNHV